MNCLQISVPAREISELFWGSLSRVLGLSGVHVSAHENSLKRKAGWTPVSQDVEAGLWCHICYDFYHASVQRYKLGAPASERVIMLSSQKPR